MSKESPSKLNEKQASISSKIPSLSSSKSNVSGIPSPSVSTERGTKVGSSTSGVLGSSLKSPKSGLEVSGFLSEFPINEMLL